MSVSIVLIVLLRDIQQDSMQRSRELLVVTKNGGNLENRPFHQKSHANVNRLNVNIQRPSKKNVKSQKISQGNVNNSLNVNISSNKRCERETGGRKFSCVST